MKSLRSVSGTVSTSGDHTIIEASANSRIKVQAYNVITSSTTAVTVFFKNGSITNNVLWTIPLQAVTGTISGIAQTASGDNYLFATSPNTLLNLNLSAAQSVTYNLTYWDDEV